jgi:hypothetical protein
MGQRNFEDSGTMTKFSSDIDIDFANRDDILQHLDLVPASILRDGKLVKHNSGVYPVEIPVDPFTGISAIDYKSAEERGYTKLDFLNVGVYSRINSEQQLMELMSIDPDWAMLYDPAICAQLIHIGNHYDTLIAMPEAVTDVVKMAMFLSVIRPAKRHLIGKPWDEVAKTVWDKPTDGSYYFKKSHSISYAHLVVVNMNLITTHS